MFSLSPTPLNRDVLIASLEEAQAGALVTFEGWVRNHNEGKKVSALEYQVYATLAEKEGARILEEARTRFNLHGGTRFRLAPDASREPVGALSLEHSIDRQRTVNAIAAAMERHRTGALDKTPDIAIGIHPKNEHAPVNAIHPLVNGDEPSRNLSADLLLKRVQAELDVRGNVRLGGE